MTEGAFQQQELIDVKVVAVGDYSAGKTSLLWSLIDHKNSDKYHPSVFENHSSIVKRDGAAFRIGLVDTAGQEKFNRLRTLAYNLTHVFLLVFSLNEEETFVNARKKWYPELKRESRGVPIIFVGKQTEKRESYELKTDRLSEVSVRRLVEEECQSVYITWRSQDDSGQIYSEIVRLTKSSKHYRAHTHLTKQSHCFDCALI